MKRGACSKWCAESARRGKSEFAGGVLKSVIIGGNHENA